MSFDTIASGLSSFRFDPFPELRTFADVAETVETNKGIRAFDHGDVTVVRYMINSPEVFNDVHALECRGLIFSTITGALLSRPLQKFFNLCEREALADIDFTQPGRLEEKLDGSMIGAFELNGDIHFHTRGGVSRQAKDARAKARPNEIALCKEAISLGYSPSLEWTSPGNRIIIDYKEEALTLLALRDLRTGAYNDALADKLARKHGVPRPRIIADNISSQEELKALLLDFQNRADIEGGVLVFPDGHRLKLKTMPYIKLHKILAEIYRQKNALKCVFEEADDDIGAALFKDQASFLTNYAGQVREVLMSLTDQVDSFLAANKHLQRKDLAAKIMQEHPPILGKVIFASLNGKNTLEFMLHLFSRECKSEERAQDLITLFNFPTWEPPSGLFPNE